MGPDISWGLGGSNRELAWPGSVSSSVRCGSKKKGGGREGRREIDNRQRERLMSLGEMQHVRNVNIHSNIDLFSDNTQGVASH